MNKKVKFRLSKFILGDEYVILMGWMLEDMVEDWTRCLANQAPLLTLIVEAEQ